MVRRSTATAFVVVGLLAISACAGPAVDARQRASVEYDPFRAARTSEVVSTLDALTTPKVAPARIVSSDLGIDMPVESHGLEPDGQMSLPESVFTAGWYENGQSPNLATGNTVVAAHVDSRVEGVGPFAALRNAPVGATLSVIDAEGTEHVYRVVSVVKLDKAVVPWDDYFVLTGAPQLILVTCGGAFVEEIRNYTDNYIVTAEKVS